MEKAESWRALMTSALAVVDSLADAGYGRLSFRFGGGTVLMFAFDHRVSVDIDLFIDDAQALSFLSPRLNDAAAALSSDYVEQANSVKLILPGGDIDFIVAGTVTRDSDGGRLAFDGRSVVLESVAEILAKKLLYRAASFKPRDVFDVNVALALAPGAARTALAATRAAHPVLRDRLSSLARLAERDLAKDIVPTLLGQHYLADMIARVAAAIETLGEP